MVSDGILLRLGKEDFIQFVKRPLAMLVSFEDAAARVEEGAIWLDVRTPQNYEKEHIKGSVNIPLNTVRYEASSLAQDRQYIVYCDLGEQSATAAFLLIEHGHDVAVLEGGIGSVPQDLRTKETHPHEKTAFVTPIQPQPAEQRAPSKESGQASKQAQAELEKAKGQIRTLAAQLKKLEEQNKQAEAKWAGERKALKDAFDKSRALLEASKKQTTNGQASLQELQQQAESKQASLEKAKSEAQDYQTRLKSIVTQHEATEQELAKLTLELEKQREAATAANRERDELSQRLDKLSNTKGKGAGQEKEVAALKEELEQVKRESAEELMRLRGQLEEASALDSEDVADAAELNTLQDALKKAEQQIKDLGIEKKWQLEELEFLRKTVRDIEKGEGGKEGDAAALAEELDALRVELDVVKAHAAAEKEELQKELKKLKKKVPSGELDDLAQGQELERLQGLIKKREQQIKQADDERQSLEDALEDRDGDIDRLKRELGEALAQRGELEQEVGRLEKEASSASVSSEQFRETDYKADSGRSKSGVTGMAMGAVLLFLVLEGVALMLGGGELFSLLLGGSEPSRQVTVLEPETDQEREPELKQEVTATPAVAAENREPETKAKPDPSKDSKRSTTGTLLKGVSIGPAMLRIDAGAFRMGNSSNQLSADERPVRRVTLKPFAISRGEVTFKEYDQFARATGRKLPDDKGWGRGNRPVINVSWNDAQAYVKWLSKRSGKRYRLPTEAEWEYAARAGSDNTYWWGYKVGKGNANCFNCGSEWDRKSTAPVGSFKANGYGLHNTAGNVREWVEDCYHKNYSGAPRDGSAWTERGCKERVARGGAYNKPGESMRSSARSNFKPDIRLPYIGFRVARDL
jgi:formylglycine-generating enzyme required for sulfatase activity/rhodanese-related sulfurtransferase